MKHMLKKLENTFAAAAFAEMNEHTVAAQIAGFTPISNGLWYKVRHFVTQTMNAVTFAESNCHDIASEYLTDKKAVKMENSLATFLETVGLQNIRINYGLLPV